MFLLLAANGIEYDPNLDELPEVEQAEEDLAGGEAWARSPDYWDRIKGKLLKHSSSKEVQVAIQEWFSDGHPYIAHGGTCELCGKTPISYHFPIRNKVTGDRLIVGNECVHNHKQLAGRVNLSDLRKKLRRMKDLLRAGKGTEEKLDSLTELYEYEKQVRIRLLALNGPGDLDVAEYKLSLEEAHKVGQVLRVETNAAQSVKAAINACRSFLKMQDDLRKRQKYKATGIADLISAVMRQKKGDYAGQIDQLKMVNNLMGEVLSSGRPNEVITRMWGAISQARDNLVDQMVARGDEANLQMSASYADELQFVKAHPFLSFTIKAGLLAHRKDIETKVQSILAALTTETFFDELKANRSLPSQVNQKFYADLSYGTGIQVRSAYNVCLFLDLLRKGFLRNVVDTIRTRYNLPAVKDIAGVKNALLRAADDSIIDADMDGPNCVGKFTQLLTQGDPRVVELVESEVDEVKAVSTRKTYEQMSLDMGLDIQRVFKVYTAENPVEKSMMTALLLQTWPAGRKLSPQMMGNIQAQLAKYSKVKERRNSMWSFFKKELTAPAGAKLCSSLRSNSALTSKTWPRTFGGWLSSSRGRPSMGRSSSSSPSFARRATLS